MFGTKRMEVEEAMAQLRDAVYMEAAMIAYRYANKDPKCEDCALAIGDVIRGKMRPQV